MYQNLRLYDRVGLAVGHSLALPTIDFETYSEAGFVWTGKKWRPINKGQKGGIFAVGAPAYAEHPSTEIIMLQYDMRDGKGVRVWFPHDGQLPHDLLNYVDQGGHIEAHNAMFEWLIWNNVGTRLGFPPLKADQLHDSMALCAAYGIPSALGQASKVLGSTAKLDGHPLMKKFTIPRTPTKSDPRTRITIHEDADGFKFVEYGIEDVNSEMDLSSRLPALSKFESMVFEVDKQINTRGVAVDLELVNAALSIIDQAQEKYGSRISAITGGAVESATQIEALRGWICGQGVNLPNMQEQTVSDALKGDLPPAVREALTLRSQLGLSSLAKFKALKQQTSYDGALRDIFRYCGARQTGRWSGAGAQPQNFPSDGCSVALCGSCKKVLGPDVMDCPHCGCCDKSSRKPVKWSPEIADFFISVVKYGSLERLEDYTNEPLSALVGCLRGAFIAREGCELINCDYSAIEAVVLACLAGEQWRIDLFRGHGKIYEVTAAQLTGTPLDEILNYKQIHGADHPLRKTIGKVAELASGFQGGPGSWKAFGADAFMSDDEIKNGVRLWREQNPMIVKFWYGIEETFIKAIENPGLVFPFRSLRMGVIDNIMHLQLPSGRFLRYHQPRLHRYFDHEWGRERTAILFWGVDPYTKQWVERDTYGGRLTENVTQAVARDIQANGMVNASLKMGLSIVLHTHDEITAEVPIGTRTPADLAFCMNDLPEWCKDWPIKAPPGWTGKRYCKD